MANPATIQAALNMFGAGGMGGMGGYGMGGMPMGGFGAMGNMGATGAANPVPNASTGATTNAGTPTAGTGTANAQPQFPGAPPINFAQMMASMLRHLAQFLTC